MKKLITTGIIISVLAISALGITAAAAETVNVSASKQSFVINGQRVNPNALVIDGYNYVKLAELAELLDIWIVYDETENTVILDKDRTFSGVVRATAAPVDYIIRDSSATVTVESSDNVSKIARPSLEPEPGITASETTIIIPFEEPVKTGIASTDGIEHLAYLNFSLCVRKESLEISADYKSVIESNKGLIMGVVTKALAQTDYTDIVKPEGQDEFAKEMVKVINNALKMDIVTDFLTMEFFLQ